MTTIDNYNFKNKRALIRVDFNVPLDEKYNITDVTRINAAIPSINKIRSDGGAVILMSHLGRPKSGYEERYSLKNLVPYLSDVLNTKIKFADDCIGNKAKDISHKLKSGEVLLLENLRFYKEEKQGDNDFAKKLSSLGDVYVNDAFGTAHRAHASTSVIAGFFSDNKMFGYLMNKELNNIDKVLKYAKHPFTAILGGAKVSGKILVIEQLLKRADNIIIGGGMAYTFIKALGGNIGNSMVEEDKIDLSKDIMKHAKEKKVNIYLPTDSIVADSFSNDANIKTCQIDKIDQGWMGLDIAQNSCNIFLKIIEMSKTILWNGPMGVFEMSKFENGTKFIAEAVADATKKGAYSLIGGGDSVAAINKYNMADKVSYISTGGGALLEYIEGKELPGIKAVLD
jgi:phosphoglycerate kinase